MNKFVDGIILVLSCYKYKEIRNSIKNHYQNIGLVSDIYKNYKIY